MHIPPLLFDSILKEDTKNIAVLSVCPRSVPKVDFKGTEIFAKKSRLFASVNSFFSLFTQSEATSVDEKENSWSFDVLTSIVSRSSAFCFLFPFLQSSFYFFDIDIRKSGLRLDREFFSDSEIWFRNRFVNTEVSRDSWSIDWQVIKNINREISIFNFNFSEYDSADLQRCIFSDLDNFYKNFCVSPLLYYKLFTIHFAL